MTKKELEFLDFILPILSSISPNDESISDLDRKYSKAASLPRRDYRDLKEFVKKYDYKYFYKTTPMYAIKIESEWKDKIDSHGTLSKFFEFKKVVSIINESVDEQINVQYVLDRINVSKIRTSEILTKLIDSGLVYDLSSKKGLLIQKKNYIDYDSPLPFDLSTPIKISINAAPSNKPETKSRLKKIFSNPYVIGFVFLAMEEITFGKIWKFICSAINNM